MSSYRSKKAGIGLQIQKKMEAKYDEEEANGTPEKIMEWMNATLNGDHAPCSGSQWRRLVFWLRDGTALCKFINKLRVSAGMAETKYCHNALTGFIAMENIAKFNQSAAEYGLKQEHLFQSVDLYECQKGPFCNVINCLNALGFEANRKSFQPPYEAPDAPERDSAQWSNT